jgi:hypothetical protein
MPDLVCDMQWGGPQELQGKVVGWRGSRHTNLLTSHARMHMRMRSPALMWAGRWLQEFWTHCCSERGGLASTQRAHMARP